MLRSAKGAKNFIKRFVGQPVDAEQYFETLVRQSPISLHQNGQYTDEFALGEYMQHISCDWNGASEIYTRLCKLDFEGSKDLANIIFRAARALAGCYERGGYFQQNILEQTNSYGGHWSYYFTTRIGPTDFISAEANPMKALHYHLLEARAYRCWDPENAPEVPSKYWSADVLREAKNHSLEGQYYWALAIVERLSGNSWRGGPFEDAAEELADEDVQTQLAVKYLLEAMDTLDSMSEADFTGVRTASARAAYRVAWLLSYEDPVTALKYAQIAIDRGVEDTERVVEFSTQLIIRDERFDESDLHSTTELDREDLTTYQTVLPQCESPAEEAFLAALIKAARLVAVDERTLSGRVKIELQVRIKDYRVDFLVNDGLVVEIDGRSFHDNPESFAADRMRDQDLLMMGYRVVRFPAKQVFVHADECARKVIALGTRSYPE